MTSTAALNLHVVRATFAGRRIFVTGHTGFKGSWLCLWLQSLGATVAGYALPPPTEPNLYTLAKVGDGMASTIADIRDRDRLAAALSDFAPDIVFHLAAQPLVRESYADPVGTYATNVMGTVHLLDAMRRVPSIRAAVIVSSDKCYDNPEDSGGNGSAAPPPASGFVESDRFGGEDPYSNSKGCTELVVHAYRQSFFHPARYAEHQLALASARAGNVIGGGDWARDRLIPDLINAFAQGRPAIVRNPGGVRPWQHVLEPLYGYLLLANRLYRHGPAYGEGWNFGPDSADALPVSDIASALAHAWGDGASWQLADDALPAPHEAHVLRLDCSKAKQRLGWQPVCPLPLGLQRVVAGYRAYHAGDDLRALCLQQIADHEHAVERLITGARHA